MTFNQQYNVSSFNVKKSFNVEEFNTNFARQQKQIQQIQQNQFINPAYNYRDPTAPNYVNPNAESPNRAACLLVCDRHRKKFLSVFKIQGSYDIPGGKTKMIESFEDAAIRELYEETGIIVEKINMTKIMDAFDGRYQVVTFLAFVHRGRIQTQEDHLVGWVPFKYLNYNQNPRWQKYNTLVYEKLLQRLY